jgi:hypothetical protein
MVASNKAASGLPVAAFSPEEATFTPMAEEKGRSDDAAIRAKERRKNATVASGPPEKSLVPHTEKKRKFVLSRAGTHTYTPRLRSFPRLG